MDDGPDAANCPRLVSPKIPAPEGRVQFPFSLIFQNSAALEINSLACCEPAMAGRSVAYHLGTISAGQGCIPSCHCVGSGLLVGKGEGWGVWGGGVRVRNCRGFGVWRYRGWACGEVMMSYMRTGQWNEWRIARWILGVVERWSGDCGASGCTPLRRFILVLVHLFLENWITYTASGC